MTGAGQQIFAGAGITDNQQRRIEHGQFSCLIQYLTHFGTDGNNMVKLTLVINGQILQLAAHSGGRFQHHHDTHDLTALIFVIQLDRGQIHQEILAVDHHPFGMGLVALLFQPAGKVIATNQTGGGGVADFALAQLKQR